MIRSQAARPVAIVTSAWAALALAAPAASQSLLERTPNLSGGWVGEPGVVQFNFLHRFWTVGPRDKVFNSPSFLLAAPLPGSLLAGARYASFSNTDGGPNEWELLGRWAPVAAGQGSPVDVALTGAYNQTAGSLDGELSLGLPLGPVRLLAVGRAFGDGAAGGDASWAAGGGAVFRVSDGLSLTADAVQAVEDDDATEGEDPRVAWGAGIHFRIPATPHTVSFQAANTRTATLGGSSVGDARTRWGFEFTIPFTLARYLGGGAGGGAAASETAEPVETTRITMTNRLTFEPGVVRIPAGETVEWENTSALVHTVTADPERATREGSVRLPDGADTFDSGNLEPGDVFRHTFTVPGEYVYFCVPHEAAGMTGRIVVIP